MLRVLSAGTLGGATVDTMVSAAAAVGFDGLSLRPDDVRRWLAAEPGRTPAALGALIADHGLVLTELDPMMSWWPPGSEGGTAAAAADEMRDLLDLAAGAGALAVSALVRPGVPWDPAAGAAAVRRLADEAQARGVMVQLEPFSWSALCDLDASWALIVAAGAPTGLGLLIDTWHLNRVGTDVAILDRLDVARVVGFQVSDGPAELTNPDLAADNRTGRRWPGDGQLHPEQRVRQLTLRGWTGPVGVEVFGPTPPDATAHARIAKDALDRLLETI